MADDDAPRIDEALVEQPLTGPTSSDSSRTVGSKTTHLTDIEALPPPGEDSPLPKIRGYVIESGRVVHEGTAEEIRNEPALERAYLGDFD